MASARKFWNNSGGISFNRDLHRWEQGGEMVPWSLVKGAAESAVQSAHIEIGQLAEQLDDRAKTALWHRATRATMKDVIIANGALAKGGWFHMAPVDFEALVPEVARQFQFLRGFAEDVARGRYGPVPSDSARFLQRAQQYANSGRSVYENRKMAHDSAFFGLRSESKRVMAAVDHCEECAAWAGLGWMDTARMAAEFPIGSAACRANCHCVVITRRAGDVAGGDAAAQYAKPEGMFDRMHQWEGDAVEPESAAFQAGKARALKKLLPYAQPDSAHEAAVVVLKLDGREYDFSFGEPDNVWSKIPSGQVVAHLHTHPQAWSHSEADWAGFLTIHSIEQAHVVAPNATYSLHKPPSWMAGRKAPRERDVLEKYTAVYDQVVAERPGWSPRNETWWTEETCRRMARFYGVNFRTGERRE